MKIYFAGPLFSQAEKEFNQKLTHKLKKNGFDVFLPQRDGAEKHKPPYDKMTKNERREAIFSIDRDQVLSSDIFLFVLDGRIPDEGACVELGIAYTQRYLSETNKILVGLSTNSFRRQSLNPMIRVPLDYIATSEDDLIEFILSATK